MIQHLCSVGQRHVTVVRQPSTEIREHVSTETLTYTGSEIPFSSTCDTKFFLTTDFNCKISSKYLVVE